MSILTISKFNKHYGIKSNRKSEPSANNPWSFCVEVTNKQDLMKFMENPEYKLTMKLMCQLLGWNPMLNVSFPIGVVADQPFKFKYTITSSVDFPKSGVAHNIFNISKFYSSEDQTAEMKKVIFDEAKVKVTSKILHISRIKGKVDQLKKMGVQATYNFVEFIQYFDKRKSFDLNHRFGVKCMNAITTSEMIRKSFYSKLCYYVKFCGKRQIELKRIEREERSKHKHLIISKIKTVMMNKLQCIRGHKIVIINGVIQEHGNMITNVHIGKMMKAVKNKEISSGVFFIYADHKGVVVSNGKFILNVCDSRMYKKNHRLRSGVKGMESGVWVLNTKCPDKNNVKHGRLSVSEDEMKCLKIASQFTCKFPKAKRPISLDKPSKFLTSIVKQSKLLVNLLMNNSNIADSIINCCWRTFEVISIARDVLYLIK